MKNDANSRKSKLGRYLSPVSAWAMSFGCAVGCGAFVMPGTAFLPVAGPLGTLIGLGFGAAVMFLVVARPEGRIRLARADPAPCAMRRNR